MISCSVESQLARIDEIHERLQQVLVDETLTDLEELVAELGSRLNTVIEDITGPGQPEEGQGVLQALLEKQDELEQLLRSRLQLVSNKLVDANKNSMVNKKYRISPARINSELVKSMDVTG